MLTVEPGGYFAFDESLLEDLDSPHIHVERTVSLDPTRLFKRNATVALPRESSRKWLSEISQFVFIPDNKIGWYRPAVKRARALHATQPFNAILATAPPYTSCLIARKLSKLLGLPYLLDFRDDWFGNPRHVYPTWLHKKLHQRLEKRSLTGASSVITINNVIARSIEKRLQDSRSAISKPSQSIPSKSKPAITVIPQGFDPSDFATAATPKASSKLQFIYTGVFYDAQKPDYFLKALAALLAEEPKRKADISALFVGLLPESGIHLIESLDLQDVVTHKGYQLHTSVIQDLKESQVPWLTIGSGPGQESISTGKLFEYIGARKPILGLVPEGAAKDVLEDYGASFIADPENTSEIKKRIEEIYTLWKQKQLPLPRKATVERYNRKLLASKLAERLDEMVGLE